MVIIVICRVTSVIGLSGGDHAAGDDLEVLGQEVERVQGDMGEVEASREVVHSVVGLPGGPLAGERGVTQLSLHLGSQVFVHFAQVLLVQRQPKFAAAQAD